jgi:hypothetical protein
MRALAAAIALLGLPAAAQAQLSAERAQMRADIGRTFWIENPWGKGLELCPSTLRLILAADCPKVVANKSPISAA